MMNITEIVREYPNATYVCLECGHAYRWGMLDYCDNTLDCTGANLYDVANGTKVHNSNCWCGYCVSE